MAGRHGEEMWGGGGSVESAVCMCVCACDGAGYTFRIHRTTVDDTLTEWRGESKSGRVDYAGFGATLYVIML